MWKAIQKSLPNKKIQQFTLTQSEKTLTYSEVIQLWKTSPNFRTFCTQLLKDSPYKAFFWETPPITLATQNQSFEFVLVESPALARVQPQPSAFETYFASSPPNETVISFPNLGKDAQLVVPLPKSDFKHYPHFAQFLRFAPHGQTDRLWEMLGISIENRLSERPLWASTSGLGVYWLHIRLDSYPKYYQYQPYKRP